MFSQPAMTDVIIIETQTVHFCTTIFKIVFGLCRKKKLTAIIRVGKFCVLLSMRINTTSSLSFIQKLSVKKGRRK